MCGIVGLFLKNPKLEARLGEWLAGMLTTLADRGPDSAGFAVYAETAPERVKMTLRGSPATDFAALGDKLAAVPGGAALLARHGSHAVLSVAAGQAPAAAAVLAAQAPDVAIVGLGRRMELYKEVGRPEAVAARLDLAQMCGTHAIGHTRMATESAVTTRGAHPFSTGIDQCLVHNGSLSNHNAVRRRLMHDGMRFETENDTEVAAGYLTWRMRQGASLEAALAAALADLDGFYTFVVTTESGFGVLRDPIACKPAIMVETEDYVGFGTEYRALANLPGVEAGHVFEPEPARVYFWERRQ
jgi:glutamate synthase domain-containing protein 1